ncbi:hypothetical protein ACFST9_01825 [Hymenobacter monticola]|jgi:hypothetical protein|uniref:DUF4177 domain-containing protein n=1 Tax=Hymenobacter monticola TaxID=1705399 RepID=A0ABY4B3D8_9BACT|nr:hypothetical protein [Hymenobacter monticola]UOE33299.1 hypothetical protein MTP16_19505 [Hymenobacter monticola]
MQYKVVPFTASIGNSETAEHAAAQLEQLVTQYAASGWYYVRIERVYTTRAGTNGCFGLGATPATNTSVSMVVFQSQPA